MVNTKLLVLVSLLFTHHITCMSLAEFMQLSEDDICANMHKKVLGGQTPLYTAVRKNNSESEQIIRRLVALKADPDCSGGRGWTPLRHAVNQGKQEMVDLLLELKANVHEEGMRPNGMRVNSLLCDVLPDDHVGIAQSLISARAEIGAHAHEPVGVSVLEEAITRRALKIAKLLVAAGSDVHIVNQDGKAIIDLAVAWGDAALVQALIDKGARPDFQTVLNAIQTGNPKKIQIIFHAYRAGQRAEEVAGRVSQEEFVDGAIEHAFVGAAWIAVGIMAWHVVACVRA